MAAVGTDAAAARRKVIKNTAIAAVSNMSTAYNLVNINLAHVVLENQYCGGDNCKGSVTAASDACIAGAIVGQLSFGYIGDCLGRGRALQLTQVLAIFGALLSAFAVPLTSDVTSVFIFLCGARFILGVGVGGVYPLAATIAAENSDNNNRGRTVSLVFSMQGIGTLLVPIMGLIFLNLFGTFDDRRDAGHALPGISWRLILGVGALPGLLLMPFKATQEAPAAPAPQQPLQEAPAAAPRPTVTLSEALRTRRYWPKIIGCAGGWFVFDITFYGNSLFAPTVLKSVFGHQKGLTPTIGDSLKDNMCLQLLIINLLGLPGYYVAVWLMDYFGRKAIQLQGFVMLTAVYLFLAIMFNSLKDSAVPLLLIYGLSFFFSNFGPNSTTFVLPSETFPYEVRTSLNGLSAACGKVGAFIGTLVFKPIFNGAGASVAFYLCAACGAIGALLTIIFVQDRRSMGMGGASLLEAKASRISTRSSP